MKLWKVFVYKRYLANKAVIHKEEIILRLQPYRKLNMLCFDNDSIIFPEIMYYRNSPLHLFSIDYKKVVDIEENEKFIFLILKNGYIHAIGKTGKYHWYVNVLRFTNPKKHLKKNYMTYSFIFGNVFINAVDLMN